MKIEVSNNEPFQSLTHSVSFYVPTQATLMYSADGVNYTEYSKPIPAGETAVVACKEGMYLKIIGITAPIVVLL